MLKDLDPSLIAVVLDVLKEDMKKGTGKRKDIYPIVSDYLKHLEKGATNRQGPLKGKEHYRNAVKTYKTMNAKGKQQAEALKEPHHVAWLNHARENYDLSDD